MCGSGEEDHLEEVKQLREDLAKPQRELKKAQEASGKKPGRRPLKEITCYGCGEKGHYRQDGPRGKEGGQENKSWQLEQLDPDANKQGLWEGELLFKE